jgi:hypothetical protein
MAFLLIWFCRCGLPATVPGGFLLFIAAFAMFVGMGIGCSRASTALDFVSGLGISLLGLGIAWYGWTLLFTAMAH